MFYLLVLCLRLQAFHTSMYDSKMSWGHVLMVFRVQSVELIVGVGTKMFVFFPGVDSSYHVRTNVSVRRGIV